MIRSLLFCTLLFISTLAFAQTTISEARNQSVGTLVTVSGIVTNGDELGTIRYMQDNTAGIGVYDDALLEVKRGDSITVIGYLEDYNNLLEIGNVSLLTVHSSGNDLPEPVLLTIDEIGESYEGELIKVEGVQIVGSSGSFSGNKNYSFTDGTNTLELRISSNSPIVGTPIPTEQFNMVAICSQYSFNPNDTREGYQLLPRTLDDITLGGAVNFTTPVEVVTLTKNSIELGWETDVGATPFVRYGTSAIADSLTHVKQGDSTTSDEYNFHVAEITGLEAAEIIYAQAFMVLESDTVYSPVRTYITESNSTGVVHVYFNTDVDPSLADPTTAVDLGQFMEDTLAAYINRAEQSIDMALYNFDNNTVKDALNAAYDRGVKIRFITCESTGHSSVYALNSGIPVLERPELIDGGIMHNKFAAIDAESTDPNKAWVWTGSTNLTSGQLYSDANNMVFVQDQSLAKTYKIEFEEMWGSNGESPNAAAAKFGADKADNTPHTFMVGGHLMESYFSPSDNTNQKLIDAMGTAENDLYVETMLITRSDLASAIIDAYDRGANVHVMTNAESDNATYVNDALMAELPAGKFVFDDNQSGILHHKLAIIDAFKVDSDPQVITGSHNWSNSANERNDENTIIIHDADIANQYIQQFAYRFEQNNGNLVVSALTVAEPGLQFYPNPTKGMVHLTADDAIGQIDLYNLQGAKIKTWQATNSREVNVRIPEQLSGIYLLNVAFENGNTAVFKVVKKR